jgi:hypothetical protein
MRSQFFFTLLWNHSACERGNWLCCFLWLTSLVFAYFKAECHLIETGNIRAPCKEMLWMCVLEWSGFRDGRTCLLLSSSTAPRPANLLPRRLPSKIHDFIIAALKLQRLNRNVSLFDIEQLKPIASVFLCYYFQLQWQDINTWEIPVS